MSRLWTNRCIFVSVVLSIFFAESLTQNWCRNEGYTPNKQRCLNKGGQFISALHCLFELNEEEGVGFIVFNVNLSICNPSDVVVIFSEDGGSYLEYDDTKDSIVVSNRIDVDFPLNDGVWEFIEGSVNCLGAQQSEAFCFTIKLININDNLPEIKVNSQIVNVTEVEIQFVSCVIDNLTILDVDLGSDKSTLYEIAEKDAPFGLTLSEDQDCSSEPQSPGCVTNYAGNEEETKYSLIVTNPNEIDYETIPNYTLHIWAWEGDECSSEINLTRSDHTVITVHIIDSDDLPPEFESDMYTAIVREGEMNVLLSVSPEIRAQDGDTLGADIEYTLVSDELNSYCHDKLDMDNTSADITVIGEFVYSDQKECMVHVQATQVNNPEQSSKALLIITILPDNKACPTFSEESVNGFYVNGDPFVLNEERETLEFQLTDADLVFEGNITVPAGSPYDVTDVRTEGRYANFRLSPNEEVIRDNTTIEVFVSDDYVGCENSVPVFIQLAISDFFFDDQSILVNEGDMEVPFDSPSIRTGFCATYEIKDEFQGTFTIKNEGIRPKIASDRPFDYETVMSYHVPITASEGALADGFCTVTNTNDTAIITITVVDLNDETPSFNVTNTNGILFEAVFFDVMGNQEIFTLADRASDADATASLAFTLYTSNPSRLLYYRSDGTVFTDSTFAFLRHVATTYDYTANVTDTKTDVNDGSSTCPLKFGIMGWDHILIFEGHFATKNISTYQGGNTRVMEVRPDEIASMCEEMGKIGWSLNENTFIKIDRILKDRDTYYIWVYGVNPAIPQYLTKTDLSEGEVAELIKVNCRFSNVKQSSRTTFENYRHSGYVAITFSTIIFIGVISMIIFLFFSSNSNEEARTAQHEVEQESGNPAADSNHDGDVTDLPAQTDSSQNKYDRKIWPDRNFHNSAEAAGANVIHYYEGVYSRNIEKSAIETENHEMKTFTHSDGGRSQVIIHNYFEQA